ncbi:MAG: PEPxxWA-CTERM sorting domain-containing protein [Alphaproteobacteria bacterium]|nr:PEPxxWA-CTERM sorting domain-containing protein [Alphaproteobacteria bacterium]MBU1515560.1 PEPxxWA-CTERM sorting domain-containing protein [Alphaproteobacteria bacterium]MBU2095558.1 PEPxxWA-CTERM sorting domain-containing protein [Alphaproteobacteria bacterium]MBU2150799.1 PEPxxWA-CTERM sorting domain-containing protein [Alphaproteobacteria bacterium]MBU2307064.1 PEPxxWA-CTERM sorting domain-containing protein [Alphaproteobacteria bacterium]
MSVAALCTAMSLGASAAAATTILSYAGNTFNFRAGSHVFGDSVMATIELAEPLAANFSGAVTPLSMVMTVGSETISAPFSFRAFFDIDAAGEIRGWNVAAFSDAAGTLRFQTIKTPSGQFGEVGGIVDTAFHTAGGSTSFAQRLGTPGVWTVTTREDPVAVPEPAAWALMIVGFGMAGVGLRRRMVVV